MKKEIKILFVAGIIIFSLFIIGINSYLRNAEKAPLALPAAPSQEINKEKNKIDSTGVQETEEEVPEKEPPLPANQPLES